MNFSDNNPERRNLMVTSLAFIIYYLGAGHIPETDTILKLPAINIAFENIGVLAFFAWIILFWFAWRFFLIHDQLTIKRLKSKLDTDLNDCRHHRFIQEIVDYESRDHRKQDRVNVLNFDMSHILFEYTPLNLATKKNINISTSKLWKSHWLNLIRIFIHIFLRKQTFSDRIVPYLLFFSALYIGICVEIIYPLICFITGQ